MKVSTATGSLPVCTHTSQCLSCLNQGAVFLCIMSPFFVGVCRKLSPATGPLSVFTHTSQCHSHSQGMVFVLCYSVVFSVGGGPW